MPNVETIATLFELAIVAEKAAGDFYLGLVEKFSHLPEVSTFWKGMLADEMQHSWELENIRNYLTPEQISAPADPHLLEKAKKVLGFSVKDSLDSITTLNDAYQLAHDLEHSEINTVFAFIMNKFISRKKQKEFILGELENHTQKIMKFSEILGDARWRKP